MKRDKTMLINAIFLGMLFASSSLATQTHYRLTDAEKREIEEQSLKTELEESKSNSPRHGNHSQLSLNGEDNQNVAEHTYITQGLSMGE